MNFLKPIIKVYSQKEAKLGFKKKHQPGFYEQIWKVSRCSLYPRVPGDQQKMKPRTVLQ